MKISKIAIGYIELSLAQIFLAINIIIGKILTTSYPVFSLLTLRFFIGFIIILIYVCLTTPRQTYKEIKAVKNRDWVILLLQSFFGGFLFNILFLYGLQRTSATMAGAINSSTPVFVALLSFLLLNEIMSKNKVFSMLLTVLGILLLSIENIKFSDNSSDFIGVLFILLATISASIFIILTKITTTSVKPLVSTTFMNLLNTFLFLFLAFNDKYELFYELSSIRIVQILLYAVSGNVLFFVFWYKGLRYVAANIAALFIGVMPVCTSMLAYIFLNENLSLVDVLGIICVVLAIFIGTSQDLSNIQHSIKN